MEHLLRLLRGSLTFRELVRQFGPVAANGLPVTGRPVVN